MKPRCWKMVWFLVLTRLLHANRQSASLENAIYLPNSRSISQPSSPAAASGRAAPRVVVARPAAGAGASDAGVGEAEATPACGVTCATFENKPPACEPGSAATGTP
jgi:hypothetical protein